MISFYDWLVKSSSNANKYSLFIKGFFSFVISIVLPLTVYFGYQITSAEITPIADLTVRFVDLFFQALGVLLMIIGGIRKIYLTHKGENHLEIK